MHLEILTEDASGKKFLDILLPKVIGDQHTFKVRGYKGIGRIPRNLKGTIDASKRILLDRLPRLLRGYGKTFVNYPADYPAAVMLVCDLDKKCLKTFRQELFDVLHSCNPRPETRFCIAIEEGEAWLLGDIPAIITAYPGAKVNVLNSYINDSICDTWELLANAVCPGGSARLKDQGWRAVGREKSVWSEKIAPQMEIDRNASPSFRYFLKQVRGLTEEHGG